MYSQYIELHWQLLILVIFATSSVLSFFVVDGWAKRRAAEADPSLNADLNNDEKFHEPEITSENPTSVADITFIYFWECFITFFF